MLPPYMFVLSCDCTLSHSSLYLGSARREKQRALCQRRICPTSAAVSTLTAGAAAGGVAMAIADVPVALLEIEMGSCAVRITCCLLKVAVPHGRRQHAGFDKIGNQTLG